MSRYFNEGDILNACEEDVQEYPLPDDPTVIVRVRSVDVDRMKRFQEASAKGGRVALRAQAELLAESIVDEAGNPVLNADKLVTVNGKVRTRRFMNLIRIVSDHNGSNDEVKAREAEELAEKKSNA